MGAGPDEHHCPEWQLPDLGHLQLPLPWAEALGHSGMALARQHFQTLTQIALFSPEGGGASMNRLS